MNVDSTHIERWQNKPSNKPDYWGASIIGTNISNLHANLLYKIKSKFGDQSVHIPARKAPSFLLPSPPPFSPSRNLMSLHSQANVLRFFFT